VQPSKLLQPTNQTDMVHVGHYTYGFKLKPHCIQSSHFKVDDVGTLETSSKLPVRIVEDIDRCINNVRHDPGYGLDAVTT
jgi:hypothetical protein